MSEEVGHSAAIYEALPASIKLPPVSGTDVAPAAPLETAEPPCRAAVHHLLPGEAELAGGGLGECDEDGALSGGGSGVGPA